MVYGHSMIVADDPTGKDICTLEKGSLECMDAYTHRISPVLKLEKVNVADSGVYTIRSKKQEVFHMYNVSVKGMSTGCVWSRSCSFITLRAAVVENQHLLTNQNSVSSKSKDNSVMPCDIIDKNVYFVYFSR